MVGWIDDDHIAFASSHRTNDVSLTWLHSVDLEGHVESMGLGPGMDVAICEGGAVAVVTPNSGDCSRWKRYRGGMAGQIWLRTDPEEPFRRILRDEDRDDIDPAAGRYSVGWIDDRLIFSSDQGAVLPERAHEQAQVWSVDATGADLRQHTHHSEDTGYVRDPRTDGRTIVYHCRGRLYAMDGLEATPGEIDVDLGLGAPVPVQVEPTDRLQAVVADHGGDGSLVEWRGAAYHLTHRSGPARALSAQDGVRIREPQVLGNTGLGIWASDVEGEDCLEVAALDGTGEPRRLASGRLGRVLALASDPSGTCVAAVSHDGRILVVDVESGEVEEVGRSLNGEATGLTWSPDSRYLAWRAGTDGDSAHGQICCVDRRTPGEVMELTRGTFDDSNPVFTRDGKYLALLSARTFDPQYDGQTFDLSFAHTTRPWIVPLSAEEPSPFGPTPQGWPISDVQDARSRNAAGAPEPSGEQDETPATPTCQLDPEGFEERMVAFPVPSGDYRDLAAVKDGLVWIQVADRGGELRAARAGVSGEEPADTLWHHGLSTRRTEQICDAVSSFSVSGDGERLVVRHKDEVTVVPADRKVEPEDPARIGVDLSRLRRRIQPRAEWGQMFDENGRLMATHFWRADMDGTDWEAVLRRYRPLVDRIHCVDDLHDILWETVAELNTSHAYVSAPGGEGDPAQRAGLLGADLGATGPEGALLERVVPGESSDPRAWSPLRAAGVAVRDGDVVVAVDGRRVGVEGSLGELLEGSAGKAVELTVRRDGNTRTVAVVPLADEAALRYHDWVASRRRYVEQHSGGRLGYVHVPDMVSDGWAELHRQISEATTHEGLIADVRFNHGGHTSQLVVERLARKVVGWDFARWYDIPVTYPQNAVRGPVVMVTNQWAGSDGDIVGAATQTMGYATVVGERSWGGVIGIDGRFDLVDGTSVTQPRYSGWYGNYGWGVENHGVDPDIEVVVTPEDWESEHDVQLDEAIAEALRQLADAPAATAPQWPEPRFGTSR